MTLFFNDLETLEQFTKQLDYPGIAPTCRYCQLSEHFVSHGYIYKKQSKASPQIVGKRIICSNRYHHRGCGRTQQLYLKQRIPRLHYGAAQLYAFCFALIAGMSVVNAYAQATNTQEPRHAYRWLNQCQKMLSTFRPLILSLNPDKHQKAELDVKPRKTHKLTLIVSTLQKLFSVMPQSSCAYFQLATQSPFFS